MERRRYAPAVAIEAAGVYRRTQVQRDDQRSSWIRDDQAFFAAGACHVLAWTCHETYAKQDLRIVGLKFAGESIAFHVIAPGGTGRSTTVAGI